MSAIRADRLKYSPSPSASHKRTHIQPSSVYAKAIFYTSKAIQRTRPARVKPGEMGSVKALRNHKKCRQHTHHHTNQCICQSTNDIALWLRCHDISSLSACLSCVCVYVCLVDAVLLPEKKHRCSSERERNGKGLFAASHPLQILLIDRKRQEGGSRHYIYIYNKRRRNEDPLLDQQR